MFGFFQRRPPRREIYFHEDDYCQQELLPREALAHVTAELEASRKFADKHRAPDGAGWTDVYCIKKSPAEFGGLEIRVDEFAAVVCSYLPVFDVVYAGYSSHCEECCRTKAWGTSQECALFAEWNEAGVVTHAWAGFFERGDDSIERATKAIAAIGRFEPLIYVDWAWGYVSEASDEDKFASLLRSKLDTIASRRSTNSD
jgi:hypothetical protein